MSSEDVKYRLKLSATTKDGEKSLSIAEDGTASLNGKKLKISKEDGLELAEFIGFAINSAAAKGQRLEGLISEFVGKVTLSQ